MAAYASSTTTDKSSMRWEAMAIIIILLFISQVQSLSVVRWSAHTPAVIGQSVTLACIFDIKTTCTWHKKGQNQNDQQVVSSGGYWYNGDYMKVATEETKDCSLTIDDVKKEDFTMWYCTGSPRVTNPPSSAWIYISQQTAPSQPLIWFNNKAVSSIDLPSSDPLSHMACISKGGNPAPSLYWEVDGVIVKGKLKTTIADSLHRYTVELKWDRSSQWEMFDYVNEIICKANHPGFTITKEASVQLIRQYAPRNVKILADGKKTDYILIGRGASVTLSCISDGHPQPTNYMWELWSQNDKQWKSYIVNEQNISVTIDQLGAYKCKASNQLNQRSPTTSLNHLIVIESMPQSAPVIMFNNKAVSSIDLPSSDPPSRMVCRSQKGYPPPELHWEVNRINYRGRQDNLYVGYNLYVNELSWDSGGGWHIFDDASQVVCKANYTEHNTAFNATVALTHTLKGSSDEAGGFGLIVGVGGGIIFVAVVIIVLLTVAHVKLRQKMRRVEMGSKCPSEASVAQLHRSTDPPATANPTIDVTPPDTDADIATYGNVGWTNPEPNVHWEAMRVYE